MAPSWERALAIPPGGGQRWLPHCTVGELVYHYERERARNGWNRTRRVQVISVHGLKNTSHHERVVHTT